MTVFILSAAVLVAIALLFAVPALLKKNQPIADQYDDFNIAIAKDRLKELKAQRDAGEITQAVFQQLHDELETTLAIDLSSQSAANVQESEVLSVRPQRRLTAILVALFIPALAVLVYAQLGNFNAATGNAIQSVEIPAGDDGRPQMTIEEAIAKLEKRLQAEPENPDGWFMLAKTYMSTQQYQKSADAYEKVIALVGEEVQLLLGYADALAMSEGGNLTGKAGPIVDKVLQMAPEVPTVLWMAGTAESQRGNYKEALTLWYTLNPMLDGEPEAQSQLKSLMQTVEKQLGAELVAQLKAQAPKSTTQSTVPQIAVSDAEIEVSVELDSQLISKVNPGDTLFIFAKALQGPPMPLAAVKLTASDLPVTVKLDDSMAMMPQMKLSNFENVKVSAVISKSGQPGAKPGDFYAEVSPVSVNSQAKISLIINQTK
jgi:cytochrome c-type biogenesis protein CcmH